MTGTYTDGIHTLRIAYLEPGYCRLDNSLGQSWVIETAEALDRLEGLLSDGWRQVA